MTAITTRPLSDSEPDVAAGAALGDSLLRFALRADATLCAAVGLLVAMTADSLARISGLSATSGWIVGAGLAGYGVLLYVLAAVPDIRRVGISVVVGNVLFTVAAVTTVIAGWLPLTGLGADLVLSFVAATVGLAWLQYRGVRRLA
ncbi:hypothetical protein M1247_04710 [Mycobacterium sp. 21AC1]|uniref:hypothetical protein n=1 Tax=[Mycobacterium] appelbergii TaxID=2939269 RepID=UPI002938DC04|nr:hypothetical protein [Mycobacterium sp. 21AC1]MDV3124204.1 hypothetical protein [Mycobacterium sp. 21AC1]